MKLINIFIGVGMATVATCASLFTNMDQENDGHLILPRGLEKRDAYTCYGVRHLPLPGKKKKPHHYTMVRSIKG